MTTYDAIFNLGRAITWTNVDLSLVESDNINRRAIFQVMLRLFITKMHMKTTHLNLKPNLPWANELMSKLFFAWKESKNMHGQHKHTANDLVIKLSISRHTWYWTYSSTIFNATYGSGYNVTQHMSLWDHMSTKIRELHLSKVDQDLENITSALVHMYHNYQWDHVSAMA